MTDEIIRKENKYGVEKDFVRVDIGTSVVEVPRRLRNSLTDRRHDLTNLSDDGYLKNFLALQYATNSPSVVNLDSSPVVTFDTEKWELQETDGYYALVKQGADTSLDDMVLEE